jgi:hypothetical protein
MALYLKNGKHLSATTQAFLYCWTHVTTGMWYVGSRTAAGCNPDDGYICSSRKVKPMIVQNPTEWKRQIIACGDAKDILSLEVKILTQLDAKNNSMSYNMHNGDGKWTTLGSTWSDAQRNKAKISYSVSRKGKSKSENHKQSISESLLGKSKTSLHRTSMRVAQNVGMYTNDGVNKFTSTREAAKFANVSQITLRKWVKNNVHGWSFTSKESV